MTKRQSSLERLGNFKVTFDDATDQILGLVDAHGQERQLVTAATGPGGGSVIATEDQRRAIRKAAIQTPAGSRTTIIGSSIARGNDATLGIGGAGVTGVGDSWFTWATILSGQRILRGKNCSVIGNTTQMIIDRITDVTEQRPRPHNCIIYCGSNDAVAGVTHAQYAANVRWIIAALREAGILPILSTIVPSINSPEYVLCNTYNTILRTIAVDEGLQLLDLHDLMVDPSTGAQRSDFVLPDGDGVHPSRPGYKLVGAHVASVLAPVMPLAPLDIVTDPTDPNNLVLNGLFHGTPESGRAPNWAQHALSAGGAFSVVDKPELAVGKMQRVAAVATTGWTGAFQNIPNTKFSPGDLLKYSFRFASESDGVTMVYVLVNYTGGAPAYAEILRTRVAGQGTLQVEERVPPGTTQVQVVIRVAAGTGAIEVGQMTIRNMTALGLDET